MTDESHPDRAVVYKGTSYYVHMSVAVLMSPLFYAAIASCTSAESFVFGVPQAIILSLTSTVLSVTP